MIHTTTDQRLLMPFCLTKPLWVSTPLLKCMALSWRGVKSLESCPWATVLATFGYMVKRRESPGLTTVASRHTINDYLVNQKHRKKHATKNLDNWAFVKRQLKGVILQLQLRTLTSYSPIPGIEPGPCSTGTPCFSNCRTPMNLEEINSKYPTDQCPLWPSWHLRPDLSRPQPHTIFRGITFLFYY